MRYSSSRSTTFSPASSSCSREYSPAAWALDTAQSVAERADTITNFDAWKPASDDTNASDDELRDDWYRDLVRWLEDIARAKHAGRTYVTELRRGDDELDQANNEDTTAFDALHADLHDALEAVDKLPADVTADLINRLDDEYVAVITNE